MKKFLLLGIMTLAVCGTLFSGTTQEVTFDASTPSTTVYIDGIEVCNTPCKTTIDRSADAIQLVAKKKGYNDRVITLRSTVNRTAFFNITFWPSWLTDAASGGVWEYKQNQIYLQMEPKGLSTVQKQEFLKKSQAKRFALFNFEALQYEAALGNGGEYLSALSTLSGKNEGLLTAALLEKDNEIAFVNSCLAQ